MARRLLADAETEPSSSASAVGRKQRQAKATRRGAEFLELLLQQQQQHLSWKQEQGGGHWGSGAVTNNSSTFVAAAAAGYSLPSDAASLLDRSPSLEFLLRQGAHLEKKKAWVEKQVGARASLARCNTF